MMPPRVRLIRSSGEKGEEAARAATDREAMLGARPLKRDARVTVAAASLNIGGVAVGAVVKTWRLVRARDAANRLASSTQALRHWRAARWLASIGVRTAEPWAIFRRRVDGSLHETLVMEALPGRTLLHHLDEIARGVSALGARERHSIAAEVGAQIGAITSAGKFNRDHKPSNLIVVEGAPPGARVAVIDCVGIRPDRLRVGSARMLASLMIEPTGMGCAAPRPLRMRCLAALLGGSPRSARKAAWRAVEAMIEQHGDPTPRADPLRGDGTPASAPRP